MKTIGAEEFKEQCLALLDDLDPDGLIVTKHGNPIAQVTPYIRFHADLIGRLRDQIRVKGDIYSTGVAWNPVDES